MQKMRRGGGMRRTRRGSSMRNKSEGGGLRNKILKQTGLCLLIALALFISKNSNIAVLETGANTVIQQMSVNYTLADIKEAAGKGVVAVSSLPAKVNNAVSVMTIKPSYGEPIDEKPEGKQANVYAVGSGEVTAVGENEEIGRYIKIVHGSDGESLYGNLQRTYVKVPAKIKKGQVIGVYKEKKGREFYYSFKEFN